MTNTPDLVDIPADSVFIINGTKVRCKEVDPEFFDFKTCKRCFFHRTGDLCDLFACIPQEREEKNNVFYVEVEND